MLLELPAHWKGLPLNLYRSAEWSECGPSRVEFPTLLHTVYGCEGRRWHRENGRVIEYDVLPHGTDLYGRDYQREWARWEVAPGRTVGITFEPKIVARFLPEIPTFNLSTRLSLTDPKLQWLLDDLVAEAQLGAPDGALYAESLSCAVLAHIARHYRDGRPMPHPKGGLSGMHKNLVAEYIEANLGEDLSIADMASEVQLSPGHFSACFQASFGQTPHQYILRRRVARAMELLSSSPMSVAEIAAALGFSCQSHLTRLFHKYTGDTPASFRSSRRRSVAW